MGWGLYSSTSHKYNMYFNIICQDTYFNFFYGDLPQAKDLIYCIFGNAQCWG